MASQSYDVVVLGDDFAGLIAACLCAGRGMRVLIAENVDSRESYRIDKEVLPCRPFSFAFSESPAIGRTIDELNMQHLLKRKLAPLAQPCQLLSKDTRVDLYTDPESLMQSLSRELSSSSSWLLGANDTQVGFSGFIESDACIPPTGFWERRELAKSFATCKTASQEWLQLEHNDDDTFLCDLVLLGLAGATSMDPFTCAHLFSSAQQGLSSATGGWVEWRNLFREKFKSQNGEIRRVQAKSLELGWGKVAGLNGIEDQFSCSYLIASTPVHDLLPLLDKKSAKKLSANLSDVRPIAFRYVLNLIVHASGVPDAMADIAWSQRDPNASPLGGNWASFHISPAKQAGRSIITMVGLVEADDTGHPQDHDMRNQLLDHARMLMPFLDRHLEVIDSPHEESTCKGVRSLSDLLPMQPVWECAEDETLALQALPYQIGPKHSCVANSQTLPQLGLEGQFIAGWSAAKLASASIGKKKTGLKTSVLAPNQ